IPPFKGFLSKEKYLERMIEVTHANILSLNSIGILIPIVAFLGSVFTFVYAVRFIAQICLCSCKSYIFLRSAHEFLKLMLISPGILALLVIVFVFFPSILTGTIIEPAVNAISNNTNATSEFHMFHGFTPAFFSTLGIYVAGILLIFSFGYWIS